MNSTDFGFWVATGAAVLAAFYAALGYHRPKNVLASKPVKSKGQPPAQQLHRSRRQVLTLIVLALISWGGALFAYYERGPERPSEYPVSSENADVDISGWSKGTPSAEVQQYFANALTINRGKLSANNFTHIGIVAVGPAIDNALLDAFFQSFKAQLKLLPASSLTIKPSQNTTWFTVFGPAVTDLLSKALSDGTQSMFVFNVMRYQDDRTPVGKYIYSETCLYFLKEVAHLCEGGHNRSYISN